MSWGEALAMRSSDLRCRLFRRLVRNVRFCCCVLLGIDEAEMPCGNGDGRVVLPPSIVCCNRPVPLLNDDEEDVGNPPKNRAVVVVVGVENASCLDAIPRLFVEMEIGETDDDNCRRNFL